VTEDLPDNLPTGIELDQAIAAAKDGRLTLDQFAEVLHDATLMMAVTSRAGEDAVSPLVIDVEGTDYGVAFSSVQQFDQFAAQTPFVLLAGRDLRGAWPGGLGLAINPGGAPSMLLAPQQLAQVVRSGDSASGSGNRGDDPDDGTRVPAGTQIKVGAPEPGLPAAALDLLRQLVRSDPEVRAAYQLAVALGDEPVELAVGLEPARLGGAPARAFADRALAADPGFRGVPFLDLDGTLLDSAREYSAALE
jgi:hypothetical protein